MDQSVDDNAPPPQTNPKAHLQRLLDRQVRVPQARVLSHHRDPDGGQGGVFHRGGDGLPLLDEGLVLLEGGDVGTGGVVVALVPLRLLLWRWK